MECGLVVMGQNLWDFFETKETTSLKKDNKKKIKLAQVV